MGGVIALDEGAQNTTFRVSLPTSQENKKEAAE
jgi:nitrogen-specific signal transduction histidine kinase